MVALFYYFFLWGSYLLFGPFWIVMLLRDAASGNISLLDNSMMLLILATFTIGGYLALRAVGRRMSQSLWYRR
jgi:hypothetical protein